MTETNNHVESMLASFSSPTLGECYSTESNTNHPFGILGK